MDLWRLRGAKFEKYIPKMQHLGKAGGRSYGICRDMIKGGGALWGVTMNAKLVSQDIHTIIYDCKHGIFSYTKYIILNTIRYCIYMRRR